MFTNKKNLLEDQKKNPPFGSNINVDSIVRIHKTSGTTERPLIVPLNQIDIDIITTIGARCFKNAGVKQGMRVIHCLNYNMWIGGYTDHQSLEKAGACVIPFGVGHTTQLIEMILTLKVEAISCTPSYLTVIEKVLKSEYGMLPVQLGLKLGLFGGESGLQNQEFRTRIEATWGISAIDANYGMADVMSIFASENYFTKDGLIFLAGEYLYPELLDSSSNIIPIQAGKVGELILSTRYKGGCINRYRYRTGDVIRIEAVEPDIDIVPMFRFTILGRSDEMIVVRGINLYPSIIQEIVAYVSRESEAAIQYQLEVSKENPIEKIQLCVNILGEVNTVVRLLENELKAKTGLHIPVIEKVFDEQNTNAKIKTILRCL